MNKPLARTLMVALLAAVAGVGATSMLKGRPTAMAVCDIQKTFDALKEKVQVEAEMQQKAERLKLEEQDKQKSLRQLQSDLEILAPGTDAYTQKQAELEQRAIEYQAWAQFQKNRIAREQTVQIEALYRKMIDAIGRVAKQNGYDAVLFKEPIRFDNIKSTEQLSAMIQVRKVLWAADDMDITDLVITTINNEFVNKPR